MNTIILGENLEEMRKLPADSVDLIYTDPPFNTGKHHGEFNDKWPAPELYIMWLEDRVVEMRRLLKPTGSLYLHCDNIASHYIKVMMDDVFGRKNFRNDIIWAYGKWTNKARIYQKNNDNILFYSKSSDYTFNRPYIMTESKLKALEKGYHTNTKKGGKDRALLIYDRSKLPPGLEDDPKFDRVEDLTDKPKGVACPQVWDDIPYLVGSSWERVDYATQKPLALADRIIQASSNPNDLVLDPFCGSGTTLVSALKHYRNYIGIDCVKHAINVSEERIKHQEVMNKYGRRNETSSTS